MICLPFGLFAQINTFRVQQIIYEDNFDKEKEYSVSPVTFWYSLYRIHVVLANEYESVTFVSSFSEYVNLILSLRDIISYNIIDILEFEWDKLSAIDSYISDLDVLLLKSDVSIVNLREDMSSLNYSIQNCTSQKNISDKNYIDVVQSNYQQNFLQEHIEQSKIFAKCISDSRIEYNARKVLLDKIVAYRGILKIKYDYLSKNKYDIVENYSLMKTDVLERLLMIKRMLEKYDM